MICFLNQSKLDMNYKLGLSWTPFTSIYRRPFMKRLSMPGFLAVCFIVIIINMNINSYLQIRALDNIANLISESKQQQQELQVSYSITYEEPEEEIITVTREVQEDGDIIFEYGDVSDEYYFYIIMNEEQGLYEYYYPAMHVDWPIECDSLAELQCVIDCHIEQAYPNATFVMNQK